MRGEDGLEASSTNGFLDLPPHIAEKVVAYLEARERDPPIILNMMG